MRRVVLILLLAGLGVSVYGDYDEAPPISIASPDEAKTFTYSSVKEHTLIWNAASRTLIARIVFVEDGHEGSQTNEDTLDFRLPGVTLDAAKGIFYAATAAGEKIPVARFQRQLFFKVIETLPNAVVRIQHPHGIVNVVLEALRPDDPALKAPGAEADSGAAGMR